MSAKPTLLVVSYRFAPSPLVGAKRFSFLTREFTRQGFDVHVIAGQLRDSPPGAPDSSLPLHGSVHYVLDGFDPLQASHGSSPREQGLWARLKRGLFRRLLAPVGAEYFWARAATRRALEVARELPRGVIIATSPPPAALLAGARIARKLGWPLVLDYRDPWTAYEWPAWYRGAVSQWLATRLESRLIRRSAARVLNTPDMKEWFEQTFPFAPREHNYVVPNGYDAVPAAPPPDANGPLRIIYAGEVYGSRTLVPLLRAMQRLQTRRPDKPLRLTCYGLLPQFEWQRIRAAGLDSLVVDRPRVPFAELFPELQRAHVLLAIVSDHMTYSTPYKVYDYMASGRPILGLAPPGAALHALLADSGAGTTADPEDVDGIDQALERCLASTAVSDSRIESFRWSNLAQTYRRILEGVHATTRGGTAETNSAARPGESVDHLKA